VTVGGDLAETTGLALRRGYPLWPGRLDRVLAAQGDWAVLHHRAARQALLDACRGRGIKTMVWTVNSDRALARWLAGPRADVVVTDRPARALVLRGDRDQAAASRAAASRAAASRTATPRDGGAGGQP
jgi:glycerophosphoryl diester phosphodiesterase